MTTATAITSFGVSPAVQWLEDTYSSLAFQVGICGPIGLDEHIPAVNTIRQIVEVIDDAQCRYYPPTDHSDNTCCCWHLGAGIYLAGDEFYTESPGEGWIWL